MIGVGSSGVMKPTSVTSGLFLHMSQLLNDREILFFSLSTKYKLCYFEDMVSILKLNETKELHKLESDSESQLPNERSQIFPNQLEFDDWMKQERRTIKGVKNGI